MLTLQIIAAPDTSIQLIDPIRTDITLWLQQAKPKTTAAFARLIDSTNSETLETDSASLDWLDDDVLSDIAAEQESLGEQRLGIAFSAKKAFHLKDPLNFLFSVSKKYHCEFSVVVIEDGQSHEVCFFGYEEGRPDMYEVAQYLGIE